MHLYSAAMEPWLRTPFAMRLILSLAFSTLLPAMAFAQQGNPPVDASNKALGWWSDAYNWGLKAVHSILLRGASTHSQVVYFTEKDSVHVWRWNPGDTLSASSNMISKHTGRPSNEQMFCGSNTLLADGRLLVAGGTETGLVGTDEANIYDPATESWQTSPRPSDLNYGRWYATTTLLPNQTVLASSGWMHHRMIAFGGTDGSSTTNAIAVSGLRGSVAVDDADVVGASPSARRWHSAIFDVSNEGEGPQFFSYLHRMVVFGGEKSDTTFNETWTLLLNGNSHKWTWRKLPTYGSLPAARSRHTAIYDGDRDEMIVFGGRGADGTPLSDVWKLDLTPADSGQWSAITVGDSVPPARYGHSAIYDQARNRMIIYGGRDGSQHFSDMWALSLTGGYTWTRIAPGNPGPTAREGHSAGYFPTSGNDWMPLFGGGRADSTFSQPWLFSLRSHTWKVLPSSDPAPSARMWHSAIVQLADWPRMLILGGDTNGSSAGGISDELWDWRLTDTTFADWTLRADPYTLGPVIGSSAVYDARYAMAVIPEIFDPSSGSSGTWTKVPGTSRQQRLYPFMFVLPSGKVLDAGPTDSTFLLNLANSTSPWETYGWTASGLPGGSAVTFAPGKVLKAGGHNPAVVGSRWIDLSGTPDTATWRDGGNMNRPKADLNLTVLPDGNVLATGGASVDENGVPGPPHISQYAFPTKRPQLWNASLGAWTDTLREDNLVKAYHSSAILLPDGRILSAGGEHPSDKLSATIFWPPYLFNGSGALASRPVLTGSPDSMTFSEKRTLCVSGGSITKAALIAPGAATHAFNQHQRYVPLQLVDTCSGQVVLTGPSSANVAPPGDYMLFALNDSGVPAVARWVRVCSQSSRDDCDSIRPEEVSDLTVDVGKTTVTLSWTAPGDDSLCSRATAYEVRRSSSPINAGNYGSASLISSGVPTPGDPGTSQCMQVSGLSACTTYYFAMKTRDDNFNWSAVSNSPGASTTCSGGEITCGGGEGFGGGESEIASPTLDSFHPGQGQIGWSYRSPGGMHVSMQIYGITGRLVRTLVDAMPARGTQSVRWDGRDDAGRVVPTGVYFYRFECGPMRERGKVVLMSR